MTTLAAAPIKDYLVYENERNHRDHVLQTRLVRSAFGATCEVLVAHHITFNVDPSGDGEPIEIPSADTLIFDHDIMRTVFGDKAMDVMAEAVKLPAAERDAYVSGRLDEVEASSKAVA